MTLDRPLTRIAVAALCGVWLSAAGAATREELIAARHDLEGIRTELGADSIAYLSLEGLEAATGGGDERFCRACLTGHYPTPVPVAADKDRFEATGLPVVR